MKILLAEDGPIDALLMKNILERADYDFHRVEDGAQALELLKSHGDFDLVLVDINMPTMNGLELVKAIREEPALQGLPVIFVTGVADPTVVRAAAALQPAGYLLKPITQPSKILDLVRRLSEASIAARAPASQPHG